MSQKEASRDVEVDSGTLARWERGEREPTAQCLRLVMYFLRPQKRPNRVAPDKDAPPPHNAVRPVGRHGSDMAFITVNLDS